MDHPLSVCVLASGSRGNAVYISDGTTAILIDAGLSGIEIERRLSCRGLSPRMLSAIVVTHEHADHIQGVGVLSRRYGLPVYSSARTMQAADRFVGKVCECIPFETGREWVLGSLAMRPFALAHDAEDPSGMVVSANGKKIGIATDMGTATALVKEHLKDCHLLILEANHDPRMLEEGPYPWPVKQRVQSRCGHLSNEQTRNLLKEIRHKKLAHVVLAHLSETNNTPQKALGAVASAVDTRYTRLEAAVQDRCGELIWIR
ncbi:MAG: MBL fold metallo-hydrolase [Deltaproteobacteria bacterium]|nr:MBL fold metallo-hydrolase [Deltaproteobacteria bacterium]